MDQQQISYEAIVRADIAIEIMNRARGLVSQRPVRAELEQSGPVIRIVTDDLQTYHPDYIADQTVAPEGVSPLIQTDARIDSRNFHVDRIEAVGRTGRRFWVEGGKRFEDYLKKWP